MFYIYRYCRASQREIIWTLFTPKFPFTSTQLAENHLKKLGYSLDEICRDFCFRWFPDRPAFLLTETKSEVRYGW